MSRAWPHPLLCLLPGLLALAGCKSADALHHGQSAALSGIDLVQMTDDMAMKIAGDADVIAEFARNGPLPVVVMPVENHLTAEVIPPGQAAMFTARVRVLLSRHAPDRYQWIMNRDYFHALRQRERSDVDLGPAPEAVNPRFALTAIFSSLATEDASRRSAYYLCTFQLTNLQDRTVLWADKYEVRKVAIKGFLD